MKPVELTSAQKAQYEQDGYTILKGLFDVDECDRFVDHMMDLHAGRERIDGFQFAAWVVNMAPRNADDWSRTRNQHLYDPMTMDWLLNPRLRRPLRTCLDDEPEAIQTMYFYKGSEQRRHQDAYHLPGCMSAWIALQDVDERNGSIHVQLGSHRGPILDKKDFTEDEDGKPGPWYGWNHEDAFDALFERNGFPEIAVEAAKGDAVLFHGRLIHRGGPILEPDSFRHVLACHYLPYSFNPWPYEVAPRLRISFDGVCRFTPTH